MVIRSPVVMRRCRDDDDNGPRDQRAETAGQRDIPPAVEIMSPDQGYRLQRVPAGGMVRLTR
jgi:hypothetical protein